MVLVTRNATSKDRNFIYSLLRSHMESFFSRFTREGWSDEKFLEKFKLEDILVFENNGEAVGFLDLETKEDEEGAYLYISNVHLINNQRGHPYYINRLIDWAARRRGLKIIRAKVFRDNQRTLRFAQLMGYSIKLEILDENSVLIEKVL